MYIMLRFEWDPAKEQGNRKKHGIDFETASLVFEDPWCLTFVERHIGGEERWHAIGSVEGIVVIVVAHTYRQQGADEIIRIISARRALAHERRLYEQTIS